MAYNELIKNFNRIRDYMREFYVYGFKSRDKFTRKSSRSYDESVRSWLEFSINSISKDKRSRKTVNLNSYFSKFRETWETVMKELNIEFDVYGFTDEMKVKEMKKKAKTMEAPKM